MGPTAAPGQLRELLLRERGLLVPVFDQPTDAEAISILEGLGLDRPILPIPAQNLVLGLGAVHCLTQQEPALPEGAGLRLNLESGRAQKRRPHPSG